MSTRLWCSNGDPNVGGFYLQHHSQLQRKTAVTTHLKSKQLLLFASAQHHCNKYSPFPPPRVFKDLFQTD